MYLKKKYSIYKCKLPYNQHWSYEESVKTGQEQVLTDSNQNISLCNLYLNNAQVLNLKLMNSVGNGFVWFFINTVNNASDQCSNVCTWTIFFLLFIMSTSASILYYRFNPVMLPSFLSCTFHASPVMCHGQNQDQNSLLLTYNRQASTWNFNQSTWATQPNKNQNALIMFIPWGKYII